MVHWFTSVSNRTRTTNGNTQFIMRLVQWLLPFALALASVPTAFAGTCLVDILLLPAARNHRRETIN